MNLNESEPKQEEYRDADDRWEDDERTDSERKNAEDYELAVELISQAIRLNSNGGDSSEETVEKFLNGGDSDAAMQACFLIKQTSDMLCEKFDWLNEEL